MKVDGHTRTAVYYVGRLNLGACYINSLTSDTCLMACVSNVSRAYTADLLKVSPTTREPNRHIAIEIREESIGAN